MLSPENAAQIIKHLEEYEVDAVSAEMAKFTMINQEMQIEILREFSDVAVQAGTAIVGGVDCTQSLLEKAVGSFKASEIISRVSPSRAPSPCSIVEMDGRHIFNLIRQNSPNNSACHELFESGKGIATSLIRPEVREQVIERLATLAPTPIKLWRKIRPALLETSIPALNQTGELRWLPRSHRSG
jgi:flagellar motor switch protein FliG